MCDASINMKEAGAALLLSDLVRRELKIEIGPLELADFIERRWREVATYAHAIHEVRQMPSKGGV